jgi:lysophospholipase L1-like esterase
VAYGMNDAGYADAADFAATIAALMHEVRVSCPRAEFVLVSPMLPSPGCDFVVMERFPAYRDALAQLCGEGVVLADMTTLWVDLLARKSPYDLTGNGLNHPNDFGHRLYAQMILALLAG